MRDRLVVNQKKAIDLGLNLNQASVYHTLLDLQQANDPVFTCSDSGHSYYYIPYRAVSEELPLMDCKVDTIYRHISQLESIGLVERFNFSDRDAHRFLNDNHSVGCLFCGYNKYTLHEHHYPVRRAEGGTETITLCPNCHSAFHALTDFGLIRAISQ